VGDCGGVAVTRWDRCSAGVGVTDVYTLVTGPASLGGHDRRVGSTAGGEIGGGVAASGADFVSFGTVESVQYKYRTRFRLR